MWANLKTKFKQVLIAASIAAVSIAFTWLWLNYFSNEKQVDQQLDIVIAKPSEVEQKLDIEKKIIDIVPELQDTAPIEKDKDEVSNTKNYDEELAALNDYIVGLYGKINEQSEEISQLRKELKILKNSQALNNSSDNRDKVSILLVELYKVKNLALSGYEFGTKVEDIYPLAGNINKLKENLLKLKTINILPNNALVTEQLETLEREVVKQHQQEQKTTVTQAIKIAFSDLVQIKKVKNLSKNSLLYKFSLLETAIAQDDYITAYTLSQDLPIKSENLTKLSQNLKTLGNFSKIIEESLTIIYNVSP